MTFPARGGTTARTTLGIFETEEKQHLTINVTCYILQKIGGNYMSYGIEVYDTDGTTKVLNNSMRYINRMTDDVTLSGASSHTFNFDATGLSSSNCAVLIDGFQIGRASCRERV
mgnify:CR=1 FL=1